MIRCKETVQIWSRETNSVVDVAIALEIDTKGIARLIGFKANRNRSGMSKLAHGSIIARRIGGRVK